MSLVDGVLKIRLAVQEGRVSAVEIASPRANVASVFCGRTLEEACALAANLFSLCPAAQSLATQAAGEAALGRSADALLHRTRVLRLLCERFGEMLRASLLDWPGAAPPDPDSLACLRTVLVGLRALPEQGDAARRSFERVRQAAKKLGLKTYADGDASFFARQWAEVQADEANWDSSGSRADFLGAADDDFIAEVMIDADFWRAPELPGRCVETGACARQDGAFPSGRLAARLAARYADMASALDAIGLLLAGGAVPLEALVAKNLGGAEGFAAVESARGRLFHRLALDAERRIVDYRIVAPTEWNFHPEGPLKRLLLGAPIGSGAVARLRAERLALAFDPCVRVGVEVVDQADA